MADTLYIFLTLTNRGTTLAGFDSVLGEALGLKYLFRRSHRNVELAVVDTGRTPISGSAVKVFLDRATSDVSYMRVAGQHQTLNACIKTGLDWAGRQSGTDDRMWTAFCDASGKHSPFDLLRVTDMFIARHVAHMFGAVGCIEDPTAKERRRVIDRRFGGWPFRTENDFQMHDLADLVQLRNWAEDFRDFYKKQAIRKGWSHVTPRLPEHDLYGPLATLMGMPVTFANLSCHNCHHPPLRRAKAAWEQIMTDYDVIRTFARQREQEGLRLHI